MQVFFDCEYRNKYNRKDIVAIAFKVVGSPEYSINPDYSMTFDYRDDFHGLVDQFDEWERLGASFMCYSANADLPVLLTLGIDIKNIDFIDLYQMFLPFSYSHPTMRTQKPNLVNCMIQLAIEVPYDDDEKDDTRNIILYNAGYDPFVNSRDEALCRRRSNNYTQPEISKILKYCEKDVQMLPKIFNQLVDFYSFYENKTGKVSGSCVDDAYSFGDYLKAVAITDHRNQGWPVNVERLESLYDNMSEIRKEVAEAINGSYPADCYVKKTKKEDADYAFNTNNFTYLLAIKGMLKTWPMTPTLKVKLDSDTFEDKLRSNKYLTEIYRARKTIQAMNGKTDLRQFEKDGYVKAKSDDFWMSKPFGTKTGRSSPQVSKGFIMNMTPVLRNALIEVPEGKVMIGVDYSAQEVAIAASLSGDRNLRKLYMAKVNGKDIYTEIAKMVGIVPANATPQSHPKERAMAKIVQLGISYGKGRASLAADIYGAGFVDGKATVSYGDAEQTANEIYYWHKSHFEVFWNYVESVVIRASRDKVYYLKDGWASFYSNTNNGHNAWINFPIQGTGASMIRAVHTMACYEDLDVIATHHDAIYVMADVGKADETLKTIYDIMDDAAYDTIGDFCPCLSSGKVYNHGELYSDGRGNALVNKISERLDWGLNWK